MAANILQQVFKKVYGKPAWQVHKGYGSFITFEFGKPKLRVSKKMVQPKAGKMAETPEENGERSWRLASLDLLLQLGDPSGWPKN